MAYQLWKKLFELEVEFFARDVGIGGHVEVYELWVVSCEFWVISDEGFEVFFFEQGGAGDGDGFATTA